MSCWTGAARAEPGSMTTTDRSIKAPRPRPIRERKSTTPYKRDEPGHDHDGHEADAGPADRSDKDVDILLGVGELRGQHLADDGPEARAHAGGFPGLVALPDSHGEGVGPDQGFVTGGVPSGSDQQGVSGIAEEEVRRGDV